MLQKIEGIRARQCLGVLNGEPDLADSNDVQFVCLALLRVEETFFECRDGPVFGTRQPVLTAISWQQVELVVIFLHREHLYYLTKHFH